MDADTDAGARTPLVMKNPMYGRVATWSSHRRGKEWSLWTPCKADFLAEIVWRQDRGWVARIGLGDEEQYPTKNAALLETSRKVAHKLDLEIRTTTRTLVHREGGVQDPLAATWGHEPPRR